MAMGANIDPALGLRDLPRKYALLCLEIENFCSRELKIAPGDDLVLAVSGGADSLAMALIFTLLKERLGIGLHALHINHNLREEAGEDAEHARKVCTSLGMECQIVDLDTRALAEKHGIGLEEAGRMGRYELLEKFRAKLGFRFIAVAHHLGDLGEDVIMRLLRGTGWPALGGMREKDEKRRLIRPLLYQDPQSLRDMLRHSRISWREDASNADNCFKRNRVRNSLIPLLREENPNFYANIAKLREMAREDADFWQKYIEAALRVHPWEFWERNGHFCLVLSKALLENLHPAARQRLFLMALQFIKDRYGRGSGPRYETLRKLEEACRLKRYDKIFQFSGETEARFSGGDIVFSGKEEA